ncbi:hypothetical protein FA10DRAFT_303530 [Acaromyces ingoldii]|uniref:Transmembrane protein n=1 Tax=Acaromyces ingoldii TaxID=215250 RepID=A0A316YGB8_9BASI|nr:hypothetical protein FA10DRAFT_303530 [Acaromyces ingoldii]PWN88580.1 hypothetical protein FA10DRAFT_303530 [Acaromyces ingoldii]
MLYRFTSILVVAAALCILLLTAQPGAAQNATPAPSSNSNNSSNRSSSTSGNATMSGNVTVSGNSTASGNQTSSSTPTTFPTATIPSTGGFAGTQVAPGPVATGSGGKALGPDDNYIAGAVARYGGGARGLVSLALGVGTLFVAGYLVL